MKDETIKIVLVIAGIVTAIYLLNRHVKTSLVEGLENNLSLDGEAGNAGDFLTNITNLKNKIHDGLLVDKYRTDYENIIINMDDLFSNLMLKTMLSMKLDPDKIGNSLEKIHLLNELSSAKDSLDKVMKFVDGTATTSASATQGLFG